MPRSIQFLLLLLLPLSLPAQIAPKEIHSRGVSLALKNDGTIWTWGTNVWGLLGVPGLTQRLTPGPVSLPGRVRDVASGRDHFLVLLEDGRMFSWGRNDDGQLGHGDYVDRPEPTEIITGYPNIVGIGCGDEHCIAIRSSSWLIAWGKNNSAQLGFGWPSANEPTPMPVPSFNGVVAVDGGDNTTFALMTDGRVFSWGTNNVGRLGRPTTQNPSNPMPVTFVTNAVEIAADYRHTLVRTANGDVWGWGWNINSEVAAGTSVVNPPVTIPGFQGATRIAAGLARSFAVMPGGGLMVRGSNSVGAAGTGTGMGNVAPATPVPGVTDAVAVFATNVTSWALRSDGTLQAWGNNYTGQLGIGVTMEEPLPVNVPGLSLIACDDAACLVSNAPAPVGGMLEVRLGRTTPLRPVLVLADPNLGAVPLGPGGGWGTTSIAISPFTIPLADPSNTFGPSLTVAQTDGEGDWEFTMPLPNDPAITALTFHVQGFVADFFAPNFVFHLSNLETVTFQ